MARPRSTFLTDEQLKRMDRMAMDQCKHRTIAEALGVGRAELRTHYMPRLLKKGAEGRVELAADQRAMQSKQPSIAIFRGKNYLGQTDTQTIKTEAVLLVAPVDVPAVEAAAQVYKQFLAPMTKVIESKVIDNKGLDDV